MQARAFPWELGLHTTDGERQKVFESRKMMEVRMNQTTRVGVISAGIWNSDLK
jgi:hypothetical protein